ncbi:MAG: flagellin [Alphaproteobacteria bacterium]|nr:flagellin [Alphaproteobacteria bacterium]
MNSINTNVAAMTALQSLNQTNKNLLETQQRISTGLRVNSAQDDAAYFSMATTMRSDSRSLSTVNDALGLGAATVDVAYTAVTSAIEVADEMKAKLVAAREPGVDRSKVQSEIDALQDQLRSIAGSASFTGENFLSVDNGQDAGGTYTYTDTEEVVASFTRSGNAVSVGTISIDVSSTYLFNSNTDGQGGAAGSGSATAGQLGILGSQRYTAAEAAASTEATAVAGGIVAGADTGSIVVASHDGTSEIDVSTASDTEIDDFISAVDRAIQDMTTSASDLGSAKKRIDLQQDFVGALMDSIDRGIGALVDADMNEESTRLQALQVQQQLGIQSLSIANSSAQNILSLFR